MTTSQEKLTDAALRDQVALACRILATEGYADLTLGHVSVRAPDGKTMYIKRKGPGLHEIEPHDVLVHDIGDDAALKTTPHMHFEAVLHTEAYKMRDDVGAVIHSHPPYGTALGATKAAFEYLCHDDVLFADGVARFPDRFELITEPEQGRKVAEALGRCRVVLLQNHGVVIVGEDIRWATLAAITLERSIRIQMIARQLGELSPITQEQAKAFFPQKYADRFLDEYWAAWQRAVFRNRGADAPQQVRH